MKLYYIFTPRLSMKSIYILGNQQKIFSSFLKKFFEFR